MMSMIGPGLFLCLLIIASTVTLYFLIRSKHLENMARIEHGIVEENPRGSSRSLLTMGVLLCFLGMGLLLSYVVSRLGIMPEYISLPTCLLIMGGIGLIVGYLINTRGLG